MTFLWPQMLWLLPIVPILAGLYVLLLRRRKRGAVRYSGLSIVREAMGTRGSWRRHLPPALLLTAVTLMIIAVARPAAVVTLPSQRGTVILTMDISGSMRASDIEPSRIEAAQEAARAFVRSQPRNVRIGVVAFAGTATVVQAPTTEREDIFAAINRFRAQRGTAIGSGILTSLQTIFEDSEMIFDPDPELSDRFGSRGAPLGSAREPAPAAPSFEPRAPGSYASAVVVLLSDGQTTQGPDPIEAAGRAADLGIRIFTVGLGTTDGEILGFMGRRMRVQLDEDTLKTIANRTDGRYFRAGTGADLTEIYKALSTQLILETDKTEITAFFTAAAATLTLVAALVSVMWFSRIV